MANSSALPCPPVALIVFNRPDYTAKVLERIREARPARLFVIADGPRFGRVDDRERCQAVRKLVDDSVDWECDVTRFYSDTNMGCAARVSSGLKAVFDAVEEALILEDDCVPAPSFFPFCGELLERYRDEPRVGMIAGTNFRGVLPAGPESCLFSTHYSVWGWATWRRAHAGFDPTMAAWRRDVHPVDLAENWSDSRSRRVHEAMFDACRECEVDTWDIQWSFHLSARHQMSAVAGVNLVSNIGVEGAHTQGASSDHSASTGMLRFPLHLPEVIEMDGAYNRVVAARHRLYSGWLRALWVARVRRLLGLRKK